MVLINIGSSNFLINIKYLLSNTIEISHIVLGDIVLLKIVQFSEFQKILNNFG